VSGPVPIRAGLERAHPCGEAEVTRLADARHRRGREGELGQTGPAPLTRAEIEGIGQLLPYLTYVGGELRVDGTPVSELWEGSRSLLLYLPARAVENFRSVREAFGRHFEVSVNCALKACYVGPVLSSLRAAGAGAEVASELEWRAARAVGFPPDRIAVNGICRTPRLLERAIGEHAALIGIDGEEEFERVQWHAERLGRVPRVMVRVNPLEADAFFSDRSKLGLDSEAALALLEQVARSRHVRLGGLHCHQLSRCADPQRFGLLARHLRALAEQFASSGGEDLRILDLGGGIEARYLLERAGHTIEEFALAAREELLGMDGVRLVLEPGRYVFGDAAIALTRVLGTKRKDGHRWLLAEVGSNLLPPTSDRAYPPLPLSFGEGEEWLRFQLADPTPTPARICLDALLPQGAHERGLALLGVGAYTAVRASVWSGGLPDIGVLAGGSVEVIFDLAAQEAAFRALYGVELDRAGF